MGRKSKRKQNPDKDEQARADRKEFITLCSSILEVAMKPPQLTPTKQWEEFLQLHDLVEKIRKKQQDELFKGHKREDKKAAFVNWLTENGVDIESKLCIKKCGDEGYGIVAVSEIKEGEMFLAIPRKLMMTDANVADSAIRNLIKTDRILSTMPHVALGLFLLVEKLSDQSFWKPYIDFLPTTYSIPLYFTPEEFQRLQGSPTLSEALKQYKNIARQYAYFYKTFQGNAETSKIFDKDRFTFDAYRWAVSTIMSRQNQIPSSDGLHLVTALIPAWDLLNHCNGTITTGYSLHRDTSESLAERNYSPGEQVRMFYGARPNSHFLLFMGFVYPENEHDSVNIQLGVSKNDRLYAMKSQLLAMLGMNDMSHSFYVRRGEEPVPPELLTFLRVFSMNDEQLRVRLLENRSLIGDLIKPNCIVSKHNEMKVWAYLDIRLRLLLQQYKTSVEDDEEKLKDTKLSTNSKMGILQLQCEKQTLESTIDYIGMKKEIVENLPDDATSYEPKEGIPGEVFKALPEPPLASEEDSDINTVNGSSENSRESDFEDILDDRTKEEVEEVGESLSKENFGMARVDAGDRSNRRDVNGNEEGKEEPVRLAENEKVKTGQVVDTTKVFTSNGHINPRLSAEGREPDIAKENGLSYTGAINGESSMKSGMHSSKIQEGATSQSTENTVDG